MTKKALSIILACACTLGAGAATGTIEYTYADGNLNTFGKGKKEVIDVAMCINDPGLAGMKLTGFKAYINGTQGIAESSLWLSKNLKIENKVNVPDVASYDVTPTTERVGIRDYGVMEVTLPEPYTLTDEPLYLGYTIDIDDVTSASAQAPVVYSRGVENHNGMWLHMSKTILKWLDYNKEIDGNNSEYGVAYIVAYLQADLPEYSLGFTGQSPIFVMENEKYQGEFFVNNLGVNNVSSFSYVYTYDTNEVEFEGSVTLDSPLEPAVVTSYPVLMDFEGVEGYGQHLLNITITEVNGQPNESLNPSIEGKMNVMPFIPKHRPLIEEYTGTWCQWCPRGYIAMELIAENYGDDQVSVCFHSNEDPMAITSNFPMNISSAGYPNASIDREKFIDPYEGSYPGSVMGINRDIDKAIATRSVASIEVEATLEDNIINAVSHVRFIADFDDHNYQIGYILVANGLTNPTWYQINAYSGRTGYEGTPLYQLTQWDQYVFGLVFNDVAIDVTGMMGVANSIPAVVKVNEDYTNEISFNISANRLAQMTDDLVVTTYIIDKNTGRIINANKCAVNSASSGLDAVNPDAEIVSTVYYDLTGRKVTDPVAGSILIRLDSLSDGSIRSSKVVF